MSKTFSPVWVWREGARSSAMYVARARARSASRVSQRRATSPRSSALVVGQVRAPLLGRGRRRAPTRHSDGGRRGRGARVASRTGRGPGRSGARESGSHGRMVGAGVRRGHRTPVPVSGRRRSRLLTAHRVHHGPHGTPPGCPGWCADATGAAAVMRRSAASGRPEPPIERPATQHRRSTPCLPSAAPMSAGHGDLADRSAGRQRHLQRRLQRRCRSAGPPGPRRPTRPAPRSSSPRPMPRASRWPSPSDLAKAGTPPQHLDVSADGDLRQARRQAGRSRSPP